MSAPTPAHPWQIKPLQITDLAESYPVTAEGFTVGRSDEADVQIRDSGFPYVSGLHACLSIEGGVPVIADLGSRNGTLVNGSRVTVRALSNGDVVQLGELGPRFAVVRAGALQDTPPMTAVAGAAGSAAPTELPSDADLETMIRHRVRRGRRLLWTALVAVAVIATAALWALHSTSAAKTARLRALSNQLAAELAAATEAAAHRHATWQTARERLERESAALIARLRRLETSAGVSASELQQLQAELADTQAKLELYDPVNIKARSLREVRQVVHAVVFLETKTHFRHYQSGAVLFVQREDGRATLNFDREGEPVTVEAFGSGFCVTDAGYVITNAHVIESDISRLTLQWTDKLRPDPQVAAVFSGTAQRHDAEIVKVVHEGATDLALLKIEPFEGMPHLPDLDIHVPVPPPGTVVYLCGFPLGTMALQPGKTVIASTFKGIVSRIVPPYVQVDAAVHPGNSGGPVLDVRGRIVGIVTRVQRTPKGPYAATIGYVLPVSAFEALWPPPR